MRHEIEASTDSGALVLFDRSLIPAGLEHRPTSGPAEILERMGRAGLACWIRTDSAGPVLLHLYVDEPIPERLRGLAESLEAIPVFPVPSGELRLAGLEDAIVEPAPGQPRRAPTVGAATVPPGRYRLGLARVDHPAGSVPRAFRAEAPGPEYLVWISMKLLIPLSIGAWIGLVVLFFTTVRVPLPDWTAGMLGLLFILPFAVRRLDVFAAARARYARLEREHPAIVILLESVGAPDDRGGGSSRDQRGPRPGPGAEGA